MHESNHFGLHLDLVQTSTLAFAAIGQTLVRTFSNVYLNSPLTWRIVLMNNNILFSTLPSDVSK